MSADATKATLILNWKEIEIFVKIISTKLIDLSIDRLIIPEREEFPGGYLKGEWSMRLTGRNQECALIVSTRPRHPYLFYVEGKGPRASQKATHSPFDQALSKYLRGLRVVSCEAVKQERTVVFGFSHATGNKQLGLVLNLIPANPEALLVELEPPGPWPILLRSRTLKNPSTTFLMPDGARAPKDPVVRHELVSKPEALGAQIVKSLRDEAFELRFNYAAQALREQAKHASARLAQSEAVLQEALKEPDWQHNGDLLKAVLFDPPPFDAQTKSRKVLDYVINQEIAIPCDSRLTCHEQVQKFYQFAKRKGRRISEAQSRIEQFKEKLNRMERALAQEPSPNDWNTLRKWEELGGLASVISTELKKEKRTGWLGKTFLSKDNLTIWVGKSKDENLELTFKHLRGNDLWLHVRGRPGTHVGIPLTSGRSAPLETLLDAASLAVFYSGGEKWGKTEVDYTYKKYVKRIKDSTEVSYTNNKTLVVAPDANRLKRLLSQLG